MRRNGSSSSFLVPLPPEEKVEPDVTLWQAAGAFFGGILATMGIGKARRTLRDRQDEHDSREPATRIVAAIDRSTHAYREGTASLERCIRDEGEKTRSQIHSRLNTIDAHVAQVGRDVLTTARAALEKG